MITTDAFSARTEQKHQEQLAHIREVKKDPAYQQPSYVIPILEAESCGLASDEHVLHQ